MFGTILYTYKSLFDLVIWKHLSNCTDQIEMDTRETQFPVEEN